MIRNCIIHHEFQSERMNKMDGKCYYNDELIYDKNPFLIQTRRIKYSV